MAFSRFRDSKAENGASECHACEVMADLESSGAFHYAVLNERMDGQRRRTERFVVRGESESRGRSWKEVVGPERAVAHGMRSQRKWQGAGTRHGSAL